MTQQTRRISQKYFDKNGGIDEVFNNLEKKQEFEKFLSKLLDSKFLTKKVSWTQKRNKTK
jgi:hypothetical protein